jgi:hypothetical protein
LLLSNDDDYKIQSSLHPNDMIRRVSYTDPQARFYKQSVTFKNAMSRIREIGNARNLTSHENMEVLRKFVTGSAEYFKDLEFIYNKLEAIGSALEKSNESTMTQARKNLQSAIVSAHVDFEAIKSMYLQLLSCI